MADYIIQAGDTLAKIAKAHGTTVEELAKRNNISNVDCIYTGKKLTLDTPAEERVSVPEDYTKMQDRIGSLENELINTQARMQTPQERSFGDDLFMFGSGVAALGTAQYLGKKGLPIAKKAGTVAGDHVKKTAEKVNEKIKKTTSNVKEKVTNTKNNVTKKVKSELKTANKKMHKLEKQGVKKYNKVKKATTKTFNRSERLLNGKRVQIKGQKIKLSKGSKLLGKAAVPLAVLTGVAETVHAYDKGGTKAAVKQGIKSTAGIAGGWAGAKVGAAIGTAICPGVGTAIGGFLGGIAGYFCGESLADKAV